MTIYSRNSANYLDDFLPRPGRGVLQRSMQDQAARQGAAYEVNFVSSAAEIPEELWSSGFRPPLEGRWLYEAFERSGLETQFTFLYALVSQGSVPAAVAPIFVMDVPVEQATPEQLLKPLRIMARFIPSILFQRTLFVGSPCSEGTIGVAPSANRREVLLALQKAFEKKARELRAELIVWKDLPTSMSEDFDWLMQRRRLCRVVSFPATLVEFASQRKSDYFGQLKSSRRYALKKKLKLSEAQADLDVQILQQPDLDVLLELFCLFRQTYCKSKMKFEELNFSWFEKIAELNITYFVTLKEKSTGAIVAFMMCFDCKTVLFNKYVGFDYSKPKSWSLYFRLWDAVIDWALSRGYSSIHSGQNTYQAKIEMGHNLIPLFNYIQHRNVLLDFIFRRIVRKTNWATLDEDLALFLKAYPNAYALPKAGHRQAGATFSFPALISQSMAAALKVIIVIPGFASAARMLRNAE